MARFIVETRNGTQTEIIGKDGVSLMKLIRRAGIDELVAQCGGSCACATCHIYVTWPEGVKLEEMGPAEGRMLSTASDRNITPRLSCQIKFDASLDGLHVCIAPEDTSSF